MLCPKCKNEILEESLFCSKCGASLNEGKSTEIAEKPKNVKKGFPKLKSKLGITIIIIIFILVAISVTIIMELSPSKQFLRAINKNNAIEASTIYKEKIEGNTKKEASIAGSLNSDVKDIEKSFIQSKLDYNAAIVKLKEIQDIGIILVQKQITLSRDSIYNLNESRTAFKQGTNYLNKKDYPNAFSKLKKVIKTDDNYSKAQDLISNSQKDYKADILTKSEESASKKDYAAAITTLTNGLIAFPNDSDITIRKSDYEGKKAIQLKIKIEETKSNQEVMVESASIITQDTEYRSLYPDMIKVLVTNNSNKTVKNMQISSLAYDKNNLPITIKTEYSFSNATYEFLGHGDNVNIIPKATYGDGVGWNLDESHGIKTVLSCVKSVEYYDGTSWTNPYYDYWLEEYKEKELKQ